MKADKGQKYSEWLENGKFSEQEVTTARVFLITGTILGIALGILLFILILIIFK